MSYWKKLSPWLDSEDRKFVPHLFSDSVNFYFRNYLFFPFHPFFSPASRPVFFSCKILQQRSGCFIFQEYLLSQHSWIKGKYLSSAVVVIEVLATVRFNGHPSQCWLRSTVSIEFFVDGNVRVANKVCTKRFSQYNIEVLNESKRTIQWDRCKGQAKFYMWFQGPFMHVIGWARKKNDFHTSIQSEIMKNRTRSCMRSKIQRSSKF